MHLKLGIWHLLDRILESQFAGEDPRDSSAIDKKATSPPPSTQFIELLGTDEENEPATALLVINETDLSDDGLDELASEGSSDASEEPPARPRGTAISAAASGRASAGSSAGDVLPESYVRARDDAGVAASERDVAAEREAAAALTKLGPKVKAGAESVDAAHLCVSDAGEVDPPDALTAAAAAPSLQQLGAQPPLYAAHKPGLAAPTLDDLPMFPSIETSSRSARPGVEAVVMGAPAAAS
jgi:hypothetical protein